MAGIENRVTLHQGRPPTVRHLAREAVLAILTALLGMVTAVVDGFVLLVSVVRPASRATLVARAVGLECGRLGRRHVVGPDRGAVAFLACRTATGLPGGLLLVAGIGVAVLYTVWPVSLLLRGDIGVAAFGASAAVGLGALALSWQLSVALGYLDRRLAQRFLGPDPQAELERRVAQLAVSRAGVIDAVDEERRRIERDLHDGVQQRLVALGMLVGRARRGKNPEQVQGLLVEAHEQVGDLLVDLREVVWRIYPATLDHDGLATAVTTLVDRSVLPVHVDVDLSHEPAAAVGRAAYFTVSEALNNVLKHAGATKIDIDMNDRAGRLLVRVVDDGRGGADPAGGGLSGLARRISALEGTLTVHSPPGGPTEIRAEIPCG